MRFHSNVTATGRSPSVANFMVSLAGLPPVGSRVFRYRIKPINPPTAASDRIQRTDSPPLCFALLHGDNSLGARFCQFPFFAGEREIKQALRKSLLKYRLHQDLELFDRAYTYIREYY